MFTADRPRLLDRRSLLKSAAATTALTTTGADHHPLSILRNPQEQNENETTPLILGQVVTVDHRGKVTISDFASSIKREFRLPLGSTTIATVKISPDGEQAAIWCQTGDGRTGAGSEHLFIVSLGEHGPDPQEIYQKRGFVPSGGIRWSGDKSFISLASGALQRNEFVIFQPNERKTILRIGNTPSDPSFSPDSNWLAYANQEGRFLQNLRTGWSVRFGRTSTASLSEVWSPDSQTLAFYWDNVIYTYNTNVLAGRPAGEGIFPQGFSPDGRLLVYLETHRPAKLAIFDLETGEKVNTPDLRDAYWMGEISFLDTKTFRIVTQDDSTGNEVRTATIDATTGEIVDSRVIKLPRGVHLFASSSAVNPERFVNPNWVVLGDYQPGDHGILLASLETGQIIQIATMRQDQMLAYDVQAIIAQEGQLFRSNGAYNLIKSGKRYKLVGKRPPQQATSIAQHLINGLPSGKTVFLDGEKRNVFVPGLTSVVEQGGAGVEATRTFVDFQIQSHRLGYRGEHHINLSWGGFTVGPENGLYYPKDQTCTHTLTHPEERAGLLIQLLLDWFEQHPNDQLNVFTHSEGAQPALIAINKIRQARTADPNFAVDPAKLHFIFTHGPILGVDKPGLENIAKILPWLSEDCRLIGPIPDPEVANQKSVQFLLETWERKEERKREIEEDVAWFAGARGRAESVGYDRDMVIAFRYSTIPDPLLDIMLGLGLISDEPIRTQNLPGGQNHMLSTRPRVGLGHHMAWLPGQGLDLLLRLAGPQLG